MAEIAGLKLIVPSSVAGSGVSVSASGKVTFTAATSISVNGVFDSTYDNYLVVSRLVHDSSGSTGLSIRVRASGSDDSTSSYVAQRLQANNTSVTGVRSSASTSARLALISDGYDGVHLYFYGPALAQPTAMRSVTVSGASGALIEDNAITHSQSTSYDGFTWLDQFANGLTGSLTVYGLSQ